MKTGSFKLGLVALALALSPFAFAAPSQALMFDANVTNNVIMGSGIGNGGWTIDRNNGIELGLRAKERFPTPSNTFNSNGDGTYSWPAGSPAANPGKAFWSWEWSVNADYNIESGELLDRYRYRFGIDSDPSAAQSFTEADFINGFPFFDHSFGDNFTAQSGGVEAVDATEYANYLATFNLVQNSWQPQWFMVGFDPAVDATYDFYLEAYDATAGTLARTSMTVIVGKGGKKIPEPATLALFGFGLAGLGFMRLRRGKNTVQ